MAKRNKSPLSHFLSSTTVPQKAYLTTQSLISNNTNATHYYHTPI